MRPRADHWKKGSEAVGQAEIGSHTFGFTLMYLTNPYRPIKNLFHHSFLTKLERRYLPVLGTIYTVVLLVINITVPGASVS